MIRKFAFFAALVCMPSIALAQTGKPVVKKEGAKITNASDGQQMFTSYCSPCHGKAGKGDGPAATALTPRPADLSQFAKKYGRPGSFPTKDFEDKLNGTAMAPAHGSTDMPVWGPILRQMQNEQLRFYNIRKYVETLQAQ